MERRRVLTTTARVFLTVGILGSGSFLLGAVAQRTCWPRFCTHAWNMPVDSVIETTHARVATETVALGFAHQYGALEVLDSDYIVASGDGAVYRVTDDRGVTQLPFSIPLDDREFFRDNGDDGVHHESFSVKDILVRRLADSSVEVLASYHVWHPERRCYTLRVSSAVADEELKRLRREWQTVFDSAPCASLRSVGRARFAGNHAGGRMARVSDTEVLLTIGDHDEDVVQVVESQDPGSSFGKIFLIDTSTRQARMFSLGHRNPQGILRSRDGRIWSTEHGPKGGDELNLIREGQNYGWPLETYGAEYAGYSWTPEPAPDQDGTLARPVFSWLPSIGVSQLIEIEGRRFPRWSGDLLVSSLRGSSLFRLRLDGERVAFSERIRLGGARVRDLVEHPDGTIALLASGRLILLRPLEETVPAATPAASRVSVGMGLLDAARTLVKDLVGKRTL